MTDSNREALEALVVNNPDLERLETLLDQFNIFEAIGAVRQELRHSDFLAFLLNPQQNHGLGDMFLKGFLQKVLLAFRGTELPINLIDLDAWSLKETSVQREWRSIDILLINEPKHLVILIENKIGTTEQAGQLKRYHRIVADHYPGWNILPFYLTPDGNLPTDESFLPVSYSLVASVIDDIIERRASTLGSEVLVMISHYLKMLRRHIVSDSDIEKLCKQIYSTHQRALDLIYSYRPNRQDEIRDILTSLLENEDSLILDKVTKTSPAFVPSEWDTLLPKVESGWSQQGYPVLFWFENIPNRLRIILEIGPAPNQEAVRQKLFDIAHLNKPPFTPGAKLYPTFARIWSRQFLTTSDYEGTDISDVKDKIEKQWRAFIEHDLPEIKDIISREI